MVVEVPGVVGELSMWLWRFLEWLGSYVVVEVLGVVGADSGHVMGEIDVWCLLVHMDLQSNHALYGMTMFQSLSRKAVSCL